MCKYFAGENVERGLCERNLSHLEYNEYPEKDLKKDEREKQIMSDETLKRTV
jgi:hypothetical protein